MRAVAVLLLVAFAAIATKAAILKNGAELRKYNNICMYK